MGRWKALRQEIRTAMDARETQSPAPPGPVATAHIESEFNRIDLNNDGLIDRTEFRAAFADGSPAAAAAGARQLRQEPFDLSLALGPDVAFSAGPASSAVVPLHEMPLSTEMPLSNRTPLSTEQPGAHFGLDSPPTVCAVLVPAAAAGSLNWWCCCRMK